MMYIKTLSLEETADFLSLDVEELERTESGLLYGSDGAEGESGVIQVESDGSFYCLVGSADCWHTDLSIVEKFLESNWIDC